MKKQLVSLKYYRSTFHLLLIGLVISFGFLTFLTWKFTPQCANSVSCIKNLSGAYDRTETTGEFMGQQVYAPQPSYIAQAVPEVLGAQEPSNKRIYVDLAAQRLYAKEGDATIMEFSISSGKWGKTPTGDFQVWIKLRSTKMSGGSKALGTYYYLPNVPYTMYFYNDQIPKWRGFGIHGAYWHNNFGHPMSHGCINMKPSEAEQLYNWAMPASTTHTTYASADNPGTPITIYGVAPNY
jgi:lipoprotein-anchoring transpeptidase ErfK/SrfK